MVKTKVLDPQIQQAFPYSFRARAWRRRRDLLHESASASSVAVAAATLVAEAVAVDAALVLVEAAAVVAAAVVAAAAVVSVSEPVVVPVLPAVYSAGPGMEYSVRVV